MPKEVYFIIQSQGLYQHEFLLVFSKGDYNGGQSYHKHIRVYTSGAKLLLFIVYTFTEKIY